MTAISWEDMYGPEPTGKVSVAFGAYRPDPFAVLDALAGQGLHIDRIEIDYDRKTRRLSFAKVRADPTVLQDAESVGFVGDWSGACSVLLFCPASEGGYRKGDDLGIGTVETSQRAAMAGVAAIGDELGFAQAYSADVYTSPRWPVAEDKGGWSYSKLDPAVFDEVLHGFEAPEVWLGEKLRAKVGLAQAGWVAPDPVTMSECWPTPERVNRFIIGWSPMFHPEQ